ncbi:MAG: hypothetical protein ACI9F9_000933 [Candidatus Paceibacteria bacterium]
MIEPNPNPPPPPAKGPSAPPRKALRCLMLAALLHGIAYLLILPPWMGEDEPWHVEYAHYIGRGYLPWGGRDISVEDMELYSASQVQLLREIGSLPQEEIYGTQRAILDSMRLHHFYERVDWAGNGDSAQNFDAVSPYLTATHQPPLYYLATGQLLRFSGGDVLTEMWILRSLSLLAYLAVVLGSYELARRVVEDPWIPLACAIFAAWWPMHARQAGVVNNDCLVKVFSTWSLVVSMDLARHGLTRKRLAWGALLAGFAILSKSTGAGVLVPFGVACWLGVRSTRAKEIAGESKGRLRFWIGLGLLAVLALVPVTFFFSNNPAVPRSVGNFWARIARSTSDGFLQEFGRTSVGAFNWYSRDLPSLLQRCVGFALAVGGIGALSTLLFKQREIRRDLLLLCCSGVFAQLVLIFLRGTAAGRYAVPMLAAISTLLAVGWLAPLPRSLRAKGLGLLVMAVLLFDGWFLWSGLVWNQYGVWGS